MQTSLNFVSAGAFGAGNPLDEQGQVKKAGCASISPFDSLSVQTAKFLVLPNKAFGLETISNKFIFSLNGRR